MTKQKVKLSRSSKTFNKIIQDFYQGHPIHWTRSSKKVSPCWSCCLRRWPHRRWIPLLPKLFQWRPNNIGLELFWIVYKMSPPPPWETSLEGLPLCKSLGSFAEQVDWPFWMIWFFWKDKGVRKFCSDHEWVDGYLGGDVIFALEIESFWNVIISHQRVSCTCTWCLNEFHKISTGIKL